MKTQRWQRAIAIGVGMSGAIAISMPPAVTQSNIVEDPTLGTAVILNFNGFAIEAIRGGAERGQNLFHSFQEFNISPDRAALFLIPNGTIQNVFARVTGRNLSQIDGILATRLDGSFATSTANLFLINPNGIIFGAGASLNVGGSFVATTANAIQFGDRGSFSATDPGVSPLLTIDPSAFLFNQVAAQPIVNQSRAPNAINSSSIDGLRVLDGKSLLLVGGDVQLESGVLQALGGRVELGGLAGAGTIGLTANGNNLSLQFSDEGERSNVIITNSFGAPAATFGISVAAGGGGNIAINAQNLNISGGGVLLAGIASGLQFPDSKAGDITLNATGAIQVEQSSSVANNVALNSTGNGGNIKITTGSLFVTNRAYITTNTFGQGDAGNLSITVRDNAGFDGIGTIVRSGVENTAIGRGGNLTISTDSLSVTNGAQLATLTAGQGDAGNLSITTGSLIVTNGSLVFASTEGQGNAGNLSIAARNTITFDGVGSDEKSSKIGSQVARTAIGHGGNVTIDTGSLTVTNGAQLATLTAGQGDAGNLSIAARDNIRIDGVGSSRNISGVASQIFQTGIGRGGNITIHTGSLEVTNGAQLTAITSGQGDAGNLSIAARDNIRIDGESSAVASQIDQTGIGRGGNVTIDTSSLEVTNGAQLSANTFGRGDAGNLSITTASLSVVGGSRLNTVAYAQGNAGSIFITARDNIHFDGIGSNGLSSGAFSVFGGTTVGRGGDLTIITGSLSVTNGALVNSSTFGQGNAGNLSITARNTITFDGVGTDGTFSAAGSQVAETAVGQGGNLTITTGSLFVTNGAALVASSLGQGDAGTISIQVQDQLRMVNGIISTDSFQNSGGAIYITAKSIRLSGNSNIQTAVRNGAGSGGDITLEAGSIIALGDSNILAYAQQGKGGNITLNTRAFFGQNYSPNNPRPFVGNGRVDINASGTVSGFIITPDTTFIQNGLTAFSQVLVDSSKLLANSCIVRRNRETGSSFFITGSGGLPVRPGDLPLSSFPTGDVRNVEDRGTTQNSSLTTQNSESRPWKIGDPIVEPQGVYQLPNGELVMSRECP